MSLNRLAVRYRRISGRERYYCSTTEYILTLGTTDVGRFEMNHFALQRDCNRRMSKVHAYSHTPAGIETLSTDLSLLLFQPFTWISSIGHVFLSLHHQYSVISIYSATRKVECTLPCRISPSPLCHALHVQTRQQRHSELKRVTLTSLDD